VTEPSDTADLAALVERVIREDPEAEEVLVRRFAPRVRAMALARTRDAEAARDLTQEILVAVVLAVRRGQLRDHLRIAPFIHGVARNLINNHLRGRREPMSIPDGEEGIVLPTVEHEMRTAEERRLLMQALATLSPSDRQVLALTLIDGQTPAEIAETVGLSPDVVRTRKSRALKRVAEALRALSRLGPGTPLGSIRR